MRATVKHSKTQQQVLNDDTFIAQFENQTLSPTHLVI